MLATWYKTTGRSSDLCKTLLVERPCTEMSTAVKGTVSRIKPDGTLDTLASDIVEKEDLRGLLDLRDAMAGKHAHDAVTLTFRDMETSIPQRSLGAAIKSVLAGSGDAEMEIETNVIVTGWTANSGPRIP